MNFCGDVVDRIAPERRALLELARDGSRREWSFGEVQQRSARLAGTLASHGIGRGDVVMTLIGNRPEWVLSMLACFRLGAVVLPCTEQLRAKDLRLRLGERGIQIAELLRFARAAGGHVLGIKINHEFLAGRVFEPPGRPAGGGKLEIRDLAAER